MGGRISLPHTISVKGKARCHKVECSEFRHVAVPTAGLLNISFSDLTLHCVNKAKGRATSVGSKQRERQETIPVAPSSAQAAGSMPRLSH